MAPARTQRRTASSARAAAGGNRTGTRATPTSSRSGSKSSTQSSARSKSAARTTRHHSVPARGRAGASLSRPRRGNPRTGGARFTATLVVAAILIAAWTIYPVLRLQYQQERERQTVAAELAGLKDRNQELRAQVEELKTPEGVEQVARESLGLVKPGEQAYVVTGSTLGEDTATVDVDDEDGTPLWQSALDVLFGFR